jgi:hypothetical protein
MEHPLLGLRIRNISCEIHRGSWLGACAIEIRLLFDHYTFIVYQIQPGE